jgi:hypothetical protein
MRRFLVAWMTLALALAACDNVDPPPARTPADTSRTNTAPGAVPAAAPSASADSAGADTRLELTARRMADGRWSLAGRTRAARALQLSVEDGHSVLYGPAELAVTGGGFGTEVALERTDARTVYAYLADPSGRRQWVVPISLDSAVVRWSADADVRQTGGG